MSSDIPNQIDIGGYHFSSYQCRDCKPHLAGAINLFLKEERDIPKGSFIYFDQTYDNPSFYWKLPGETSWRRLEEIPK